MGEGGTVSVIITKLVGVLVGVEVRVSVAVGVYVFVGVLDGVEVLVGVGVCDGINVAVCVIVGVFHVRDERTSKSGRLKPSSFYLSLSIFSLIGVSDTSTSMRPPLSTLIILGGSPSSTVQREKRTAITYFPCNSGLERIDCVSDGSPLNW